MSRHLAILLPDLRAGGAERVGVALVNAWCARGLAVDVVLLQRQGALLDSLDPRARVVDLGAARVRNALWPLVVWLKRAQPAALLANLWPLTALAPIAARLAGYRGRVVVAEHGLLGRGFAGRGRLHALGLRASLRLAYPRADARIAVSRGVAQHLAELSGLPAARFTVIHNPAATGHDHAADPVPPALAALPRPWLLAAGTLKPGKRFDLLLDAFARFARRQRGSLAIVGEGAARPALEQQVARTGLTGRVLLPGYAAAIGAWYAHADLFVLASDHEGFGNVIVEALEQGTPVVSTDCPSGPREILDDGRYGTLVPVGDADALARAIADALARPHDRAVLKRRARDFGVDRAACAYLDALLPAWRASAHGADAARGAGA